MQPDPSRNNPEHSQANVHLSRRRFLTVASLVAASGVLAACRNSPITQPSPAPTPTVDAIGGYDLDEFLRLSAVLTEFDNLDADAGRLYLKSLVDVPDPNINLEEIYLKANFRSASPPATLADLEKTGIFGDLEALTLLNRVNAYWYSGIYDTPDGQAVATFTDALAWRALTFGHPVSQCGGGTNYWSQAPTNA